MSLKPARRRRMPFASEINVVSLMDILTTLLFFLLISASFQQLSSLDSSGFFSNKIVVETPNKKPQFTLEVIFHSPTNASIWLGPLKGLHVMAQKDLISELEDKYTGGRGDDGFMRKLSGKDLPDLLSKIQNGLVPIKKSFPEELGAVIAFTDGIKYQEMVDAVTAVRSLGPKQTGFDVRNTIGQWERTKVLFPNLVISEWVEEGA
jgi:hypothetical protein